MKKKEYIKPEVEAYQVCPANVICASASAYSEDISLNDVIIYDSILDR